MADDHSEKPDVLAEFAAPASCGSMADLAYRTLPRRIMAGLFDGLLWGCVTYVLGIVWSMAGGGDLGLNVGESILFYVYQVTMNVACGGTVGKLLLGIRILDVAETGYLTVPRALLRDSVGIVTTLVWLWVSISTADSDDPARQRLMQIWAYWDMWVCWAWFGLEIVTALTNRKRRAIHDFMAGSVVKRV